MGNTKNAGRAPVSMRSDQYAWLAQLLEVAARGGDLRVMMRSPHAGKVQRIVRAARARAAGEISSEGPRIRKCDTVLAAARSLARDVTKQDLAQATGFTRAEVADALKRVSMRGQIEHVGPRGPKSCWRVVSQLSERKVAVR